ncbi:MAG: aconitate hydratase AcnA [Verrucomicrobia bacterium]|jgi:aconitate hydratase|nr:aconitate hydratase AcnA [Verrucomicrobiota bacterium]
MGSFDFSRKTLSLGEAGSIGFYSLAALEEQGLGSISRFPFSVKVLIEQMVRMQKHPAFEEEHATALAGWTPDAERREFPYMPARVLLQDFTGVPCVVDLAALRSAAQRGGKDPSLIEPSIPVDLVVDHSVQLDAAGCPEALQRNLDMEFKRNLERYKFLRWGQNAFSTLNVLPPGLGICHQINMELLARCVMVSGKGADAIAHPDTLVGTDSHTPTVNSMGVLGWGVGGIEAEAAMLGQPIPILSPIVTGVRLVGEMGPSVTATDVALTLVQILRERGVVGHFVEYFGPALDTLSLVDRAPLANMAPEYGATMGFFPVDDATLDYLRMTGRDEAQIDLVERYSKEQGLFRTGEEDCLYSNVLELDISAVEASVAGPKRPQDRISVGALHDAFREDLTKAPDARGFGMEAEALDRVAELPGKGTLRHGSVVIASITSCTNTSNPTLLLGAGILAKKAVERGLTVPNTVKTSFAPGSQIAEDYLAEAELLEHLETLGFHIAAYGCATCIGNSGPLPDDIEQAVRDEDLVVASIGSGNRNFEGRIHPLTQANYLCSPPLVVAYALRGTIDCDLTHDAIGTGKDGKPVYLKDIWPTPKEIQSYLELAADPAHYRARYGDVYNSMPPWNALPAGDDPVYAWDEDSTYIRNPPWLDGALEPPAPLTNIENAQVLGYFGDFVTTDHISPAGAIKQDGPAGRFLSDHAVEPALFNSFGSRRGNHEVMLRGTFANIRLRNKLVSETGGQTRFHPTGEEITIYDAAMRYAESDTPLVVIAGKMYGAGSSRDWAAKGTALLGVKAVIAESYERIHRSNLVEMGILPLEFVDGQNAESLELTGLEQFSIAGIDDGLAPGKRLTVTVTSEADSKTFETLCRIDSPIEVEYFRHGGILPYVLREALEIEG